MATTDTVLNDHLEAFGEQNLDRIMADYAEDALVITPDETYRGSEEISGMFETLFAEFGQPDTTMDVDYQTVEDEYAFITWHAETPDNTYEFATDTFHVRDGEIVLQTFAAKTEPTA